MLPGNLFLKTCTLITQQQHISPREVVWNQLSLASLQQQYISPREVVWNQLSLASLVPKLSQDVCCGKGSGGTLTTLRYFFNQFSAAS